MSEQKTVTCSCGKVVKVSSNYKFDGDYKCSPCRPKKVVVEEVKPFVRKK